MNEAPGSYGHWRAAEESERDDDADWAFRTVFQTAMPEQPVSPEFTTRTMAAVAAAAAGDARRARRAAGRSADGHGGRHHWLRSTSVPAGPFPSPQPRSSDCSTC